MPLRATKNGLGRPLELVLSLEESKKLNHMQRAVFFFSLEPIIKCQRSNKMQAQCHKLLKDMNLKKFCTIFTIIIFSSSFKNATNNAPEHYDKIHTGNLNCHPLWALNI